MRTFQKTIKWLTVATLLSACADMGGAPEGDPDDAPIFADEGQKADGFALVPGSYEAQGILRAANTLDEATLDGAVGLDARAARNIVVARAEAGPFESVIALDDVKYVGASAFAKLLGYAEAQGWVGACGDGLINGGEACDGGAGCDATCQLVGDGPTGVFVFGIEEGSATAAGVLTAANELDEATLDSEVGLDARAARGIVAGRPFATLRALDSIPYVGATAFGKLQGYAESHGLDPVDPVDPVDPAPDTPQVHGVPEGSYEALGILAVANTASLATLDLEIGLDKRAAKGIFYTREASGEFASLAALDAVGYVGARAFEQLLAYGQANGRLPFCGDGAVQAAEEACDGTPGCDARCELTYVCGDGVAEVGEECDDANAADGDGCSARCRWEIKAAQPTNRSYETADDVSGHTYVTGHFAQRSGAQYWRFEIDRPSTVSIDLMGHSRNEVITRGEFTTGQVAGAPGQDTFWRLTQHDVPAATNRTINFWRWYWDDRCSSSGCSLPDYNSVKKYQVLRHHPTAQGFDQVFELQPGVYYLSLHVGAGNQNYTPALSYVAEIDVVGHGPVCGDGRIDEGEACDDGARLDGDGCSRWCDWETLAEREPANDRDHAQVLNGYRRVEGQLGAGDEDWFSAHVEDGVFSASLGEACPFDGIMELYDADGTLVAADDDGGANYCPLLDLDGLPAGHYALRLRHHSAQVAGGAYTLELDF